MRWRYLAGVVFGLSLIPTASVAQVLDSQRLADSPVGFFDENAMATFHLADGQLLIDRCQYRVGSKVIEHGNCRESVTVAAHRTSFGMQYTAANSVQTWAMKATSQSAIRIASRRQIEPVESATLTQDDAGNVTLIHEIGGLKARYDGTTLLHVYLAAPETFQLHFEPVVTRMLRGKSVAKYSDQVQDCLVKLLNNSAKRDHHEIPNVRQIIIQLDKMSSPRIVQRTRAHRTLLGWGRMIAPVLRQIQRGDFVDETGRLYLLDAEQRSRIDDMLALMGPRSADSPRRMAIALVHDVPYWQIAQRTIETKDMKTAVAHLLNQGLDVSRIVAAVDTPPGAEQR